MKINYAQQHIDSNLNDKQLYYLRIIYDPTILMTNCSTRCLTWTLHSTKTLNIGWICRIHPYLQYARIRWFNDKLITES